MEINYLTKLAYQGKNVYFLEERRKEKGYKSNEWITFLQAKSCKKLIKKGEKGVGIFLGFREVNEKNSKGKMVARSRPIGWATLFNIEQTEEIKNT